MWNVDTQKHLLLRICCGIRRRRLSLHLEERENGIIDAPQLIMAILNGFFFSHAANASDRSAQND